MAAREQGRDVAVLSNESDRSSQERYRNYIRAWRIRWGGEELAMISIPSIYEAGFKELLTPAEQSIVRDVVCGQSNGSISRRRGTSERTVANQLASIYRKLNLASRQELIALLKPALIGDSPPLDSDQLNKRVAND